MKVVYSPAAQDDVKDIFNYIAYELQAPQAARNQVNRIRSAIKKLNSMPERHEVVSWEPWASMGMRKIPVNNYEVFYIIEQDVVIVNRIFYGGRDIEGIIQSKEEDDY